MMMLMAVPDSALHPTRMNRFLALVCVILAAVLAPSYIKAEEHRQYEILSAVTEGDSVVAVIRQHPALFLLYDRTIIGAEFDDPYLRKQAAYPGFAIMQCVAYLDRKVDRAIQVGLGIGTVPSFLRDHGITTDVVEISDAVVRQAANFFQYDRCIDEDPEVCGKGRTYITDGLAFIDNVPTEPRYDVFIIDVYTGWNPVAFFVRDVLAKIHTGWLKPRGVLVLNFVGFINGPHADVPKSIYRTLQSLFQHVKCFREMANPGEDDGMNIVYFASDDAFTFNVPQGTEYIDPPPNTYFNIIKNFQSWEIFQDLEDDHVEIEVAQGLDAEEVSFMEASGGHDVGSRVQVLTAEDHGQNVFQETHTFTKLHMRKRVIEQFAPEMWEELGIDVEES